MRRRRQGPWAMATTSCSVSPAKSICCPRLSYQNRLWLEVLFGLLPQCSQRNGACHGLSGNLFIDFGAKTFPTPIGLEAQRARPSKALRQSAASNPTRAFSWAVQAQRLPQQQLGWRHFIGRPSSRLSVQNPNRSWLLFGATLGAAKSPSHETGHPAQKTAVAVCARVGFGCGVDGAGFCHLGAPNAAVGRAFGQPHLVLGQPPTPPSAAWWWSTLTGSTQALGPWPWPRERVATLLTGLDAYGVNLEVVDVLFNSAQRQTRSKAGRRP